MLLSSTADRELDFFEMGTASPYTARSCCRNYRVCRGLIHASYIENDSRRGPGVWGSGGLLSDGRCQNNSTGRTTIRYLQSSGRSSADISRLGHIKRIITIQSSLPQRARSRQGGTLKFWQVLPCGTIAPAKINLWHQISYYVMIITAGHMICSHISRTSIRLDSSNYSRHACSSSEHFPVAKEASSSNTWLHRHHGWVPRPS